MSITGTSTKTPTIVAKATGLLAPNNAIATATASSKKLEAPIIPAGAATLCGNFNIFDAIYAIKNIKNVCIINGTAIKTMCNGLFNITSP